MSQTLNGYVVIQISYLITPTSDVAVTTDIVSVSYTDIIVSPTTDSSTAAQAVTILSQVSQTQTETIYSATVVKATTATALTDGSSATSLMRRRSENQGDCKPTQSHTSSSPYHRFQPCSQSPPTVPATRTTPRFAPPSQLWSLRNPSCSPSQPQLRWWIRQ